MHPWFHSVAPAPTYSLDLAHFSDDHISSSPFNLKISASSLYYGFHLHDFMLKLIEMHYLFPGEFYFDDTKMNDESNAN